MKDNQFGQNVRTYRDVLIRESAIGANTLVGDDSFITGCEIGENVIVERRNMLFNSKIGSRTTLGWNNTIRNAEIGKFCSVAWNCTIGGAEHPLHRLTTSFFPFDKSYGIVEETDLSEIEWAYSEPLIVGNDVWIAAGVQVKRGVSVGDGAVLGGGGIFTKDVPPYEIWAGVPAKKIGQRFSDEIIADLMELKWWDLPKEIIANSIKLFRKDITPDLLKEIKERIQ